MTTLAEAIRDLEVNTAALQLPPSDLQAESCQSLQCSSGYGTMTNVSADGSIETICTSAGGELDKIMFLLLLYILLYLKWYGVEIVLSVTPQWRTLLSFP